MRYSLSSRFRGTLIGAIVGEMLGKSSILKRHSLCSKATHSQTQLLHQSEPRVIRHPARLLAQSLLQMGRFDLDAWRQILDTNPDFRRLPKPEDSETNSQRYVSRSAIFTTLPLSLYYHDNEIQLRQNLQNALLEIGQSDSLHQDSALAVGYAIAQSLKEKLNATDLIAQTIAFLGQQSQLTEKLAQVQTLLEHRVSLDRAVTELSADAQASSSIALAFYCCLSTLEDFRLCVMRSALKGEQPEISAITGALSGAYNSLSGIPGLLRLVLSQHPTKPLAEWGMTTEAEMLELADSLVAVWSGVYEQTGDQTDLISVAAIAAPTIIKSR